MASAAVMSPIKSYTAHSLVNHHPQSSPYGMHQPSQQGPYSISGLISPPASHGTDSRRTSDDQNEYSQHQRQSLPSISEALYPRPGNQGASHPPPHPTLPQSFANSNPFSQAPPTPTSRPYSTEGPPSYASQANHSQYPQRPSPPVHPSTSFSVNTHFNASTPDSQRHQSLPSLRTALPSQTSPYSTHHSEPGRFEHDTRTIERGPETHVPRRQNDPYYGYPSASNNGYVTGYPPRPRSPIYQGQGQYTRDEAGRTLKRDLENGEPEQSMMFQKTLQHNLGNHDFEMALGELQQCGTEVSKISEDILDTVRRYQREPDVQGIPVMRYHDAMLGCQRKLEEAFHNVKHFMAQQQRQLDDHRLRNQNGKGPDYGGEDEHWGVDKDQGFHGPDAKKIRRGRAAPPGRCHSCNRAETPEWRRGPDGARTLCNACGLHYAKLTRRMGSKQAQGTSGSSLRPKSMDGTSPL